MRIIAVLARVPLLLAAVAGSHLPTASLRAAATSQACPTEAAGIRTKPTLASPSDGAVAFFYPWYGNPTTDGRCADWDHPVAVRNEPPRSYPGGNDISPNFYLNYQPLASDYSVDLTAEWIPRINSK